jgi:hypothetical protein
MITLALFLVLSKPGWSVGLFISELMTAGESHIFGMCEAKSALHGGARPAAALQSHLCLHSTARITASGRGRCSTSLRFGRTKTARLGKFVRSPCSMYRTAKRRPEASQRRNLSEVGGTKSLVFLDFLWVLSSLLSQRLGAVLLPIYWAISGDQSKHALD